MYEVNHDLPKEKAAVSEFEKYGHAILDLSIEKFLADGYELGDSVTISLNTKGGALDTQVSNSMKYTTNREDYIIRDNIAEMLTTIEYNTGDINRGARAYLEANGMTDAEVDTLINALAR